MAKASGMLATLLESGFVQQAQRLFAAGLALPTVIANMTASYSGVAWQTVRAAVNRAYQGFTAAQELQAGGLTPPMSEIPQMPNQPSALRYDLLINFTDSRTGRNKTVPVSLASESGLPMSRPEGATSKIASVADAIQAAADTGSGLIGDSWTAAALERVLEHDPEYTYQVIGIERN